MIRQDVNRPHVVWLEGVLDYFNAPFPHDAQDPRKIGFGVGQQIIGLYLIEQLLQYALVKADVSYDRNHNLRDMFQVLPDPRRNAVERKYGRLLADGVARAWDFENSVGSFLAYLGDDPLNDSRYFWERDRGTNMSIVFFGGGALRLLVYALFIVLHDYPEGSSLEQRYETEFDSFEDSIPDEDDPTANQNSERDGKRITVPKFWLEGVLEYFDARFPHESDDPRRLGFELGQRVIGLYLSEMLLKYAADDLNRDYGNTHNLLNLFKKLPRPRRRAVDKQYKKILHNRVASTWDYAASVEEHLEYLGNDPVTDVRYFWESSDKGNKAIPISPGPLVPLVDALLIELHGYPVSGLIEKRYDTLFLPFEASLRSSAASVTSR
ncbi:MAG: hypothetical protein OXE87_03150 [Chloroflexi bacterium]|nr:hypothetical protein [Chloroflexota bacterium]